ncbi:hypothetical protein C0V77_16975 [Emticicia sp. TH156]|nr:hypothetical protein C0V77_16975 [Emticicia sp. TH156]
MGFSLFYRLESALQMKNRQNKSPKALVIYNQLINFFWSTLAFTPVIYFCIQHLPLNVLYWFLLISCAVIFVPTSWLARIRLSKSQHLYRKIGVRFIKKYTQDGDLVNNIVKNSHPEYRYIESKQSFKKVLAKSAINEKFHYLVFVFFLCLGIYAFFKGLIAWGIFISLANVAYNIYPIFLQQYNRIRINLLMLRRNNIQ